MQIFYLAGYNENQAYHYMKYFSFWITHELSKNLLYSMKHTYDFFNIKNGPQIPYNKNKHINIKGIVAEIKSIGIYQDSTYIYKFLQEHKIPLILKIKDPFCEAIISVNLIKQTARNLIKYYSGISKLDRPTISLILYYVFGI